MFEDWTSVASLRAGWKRVKRNKGGPGGDGQTLDHFSRDSEMRLRRLSACLRDETYRAGPLRRFDIKKPSGGMRRIAIPCVRDRVAQAACAMAIDERTDAAMSGASFAYRRGRSVEHAAGLVLTYRLRGYGWAVDGDIRDYFDSIRHDLLLDMLRGYGVCPATLAVVRIWMVGFSASGRGVSQGSPLSPILANLYLTGVDKTIDGKASRLVRYADDFLILTRSKGDAEQALSAMIQALAALDLMLHPDKTRIARLRDGVEFLGLRFEGVGVRRSISHQRRS